MKKELCPDRTANPVALQELYDNGHTSLLLLPFYTQAPSYKKSQKDSAYVYNNLHGKSGLLFPNHKKARALSADASYSQYLHMSIQPEQFHAG